MKWFKSFINSCKKTLTEIKNFFPQETDSIDEFIKIVKEKKCEEIIISSHRSHISSIIHDDGHNYQNIIGNTPCYYQHYIHAAAQPLEGKEIIFERYIDQETFNLGKNNLIDTQKIHEIENAIKNTAHEMKEELARNLPTVRILIDVKIETEQNILTEAVG